MALRSIPPRHPLWWTLGCAAIITFPQWFSAVWSLFDERAPFPVIRDVLKTANLTIPQISPYWITMPLGVSMFLWLAYELRTSKNQAPRTGPLHYDTETAYLTPNQAVHYMAFESEWGAQKGLERTPEGMGKNVLLEAPGEFQKRAAEGKVRVYGISTNGSSHELIDKTHWMTYGLHTETLLKGPHDECHTWPTVSAWPPKTKCYSYLKVEAEDVYRVWPRRLAFKTTDEENDFGRGFSRATFQRAPSQDNALLRLTQLRTEGVVIRNDAAKVYYPTHLDVWSRSAKDWMRQVIETLKTISAADSEWFATLDTVPPARVQVPIRLTGEADIEALQSTYNQHDQRLVRLEKLLRKYGIAA